MNTQTVAFVLTLGGGLGQGVNRPPPQRVQVPMAALDPLNPTASLVDHAIHAGSVTLQLAYRDGAFAPPTDAAAARTAITLSAAAEGWQGRARTLTDPDLGAMPNRKKLAPLASGLIPIVLPDPAVYETVYMAEDDELGFVDVRCFGFAQQGARQCRVSSQLARFLVLSVGMPEDALPQWKTLTEAAHSYARTLIDPANSLPAGR